MRTREENKFVGLRFSHDEKIPPKRIEKEKEKEKVKQPRYLCQLG